MGRSVKSLSDGNRYVINVDVGKKASDTELNVLRNMIRKWANRLLLDPGAIVVYPYVRRDKLVVQQEVQNNE